MKVFEDIFKSVDEGMERLERINNYEKAFGKNPINDITGYKNNEPDNCNEDVLTKDLFRNQTEREFIKLNEYQDYQHRCRIYRLV